jgi:hypothetical protein
MINGLRIGAVMTGEADFQNKDVIVAKTAIMRGARTAVISLRRLQHRLQSPRDHFVWF